MARLQRIILPVLLTLALAACSGEKGGQQSSDQSSAPADQAAKGGPAMVDAARLTNADAEPGNWMSTGRTYSGQRFSPLKQINADNVGQLGLAWHYDITDGKHGQEATPIVVDGVMYVSTDLSRVKALDAKTGKELWSFDPEVDGA